MATKTKIQLVHYSTDENVAAVEKFLRDAGFEPSTKQEPSSQHQPIEISFEGSLSKDLKMKLWRLGTFVIRVT